MPPVSSGKWKTSLSSVRTKPVSYTHLDVYKRQPFDGHDIRELKETFESAKLINKPVLLHVRTNKGKGYQYAEQDLSLIHI